MTINKIIFCENYGTIIHTLYLVEKYYNNHLVTVIILGNYDLYKYFSYINSKVLKNHIKVLYFCSYQSARRKNTLVFKIAHFIPDIFREKRKLKKLFDEKLSYLTKADIYFSGRYFCGQLYYLLSRLSMRNELIYCHSAAPNQPVGKQYIPLNFRHLIKLGIAKFKYGPYISMFKFPHLDAVLYLPELFIKKRTNRIIKWAQIKKIVSGFDMSRYKIYNLNKYDIIFFNQELVDLDFFNSHKDYWQVIDNIFEILKKYFAANRIAVKNKPNKRNNKIYNKNFSGVDILPDYIPGEDVYSNSIKVYVSISSKSLANVEKGLPISLINMLPFKNEFVKDYLKNFLRLHGRSRILFPNSIEELENLLKKNLFKQVEIK